MSNPCSCRTLLSVAFVPWVVITSSVMGSARGGQAERARPIKADLRRTERSREITAFVARIVYSRKEISDFIHQTDFPFSRYDSQLGYLHRPRMFPEGIDGTNCVYTYDPNDVRHTINHAGKPCRINTYGDSFTSCE